MLGPVIGEALPLTLAIAISPLSIVAVILVLLSANARSAGSGFLIGWIFAALVTGYMSELLVKPEQSGLVVTGDEVRVLGAGDVWLLTGRDARRHHPGASLRLP